MGVVLISYGYNLSDECPIICHQMNLVVNTFPHVVTEIGQLIQKSPQEYKRF